MRRLLNGFLWLVGLVVVLGVYFFVPLGRYTLFEHTLRIAATEPAQELGDELGNASRAVGERAVEQWDSREEARAEANGGEDPLRIHVDADGALRLGEEALGIDELRARLRALHERVEHARAVLETAPGAPEATVEDVERVLREERVSRVAAGSPSAEPVAGSSSGAS